MRKGLRRLERRLVKAEGERSRSGRGGRGSGDAVEKPTVKPAWRPYRDLVTMEPEPGEEQVYGDATPLIVEWRRVRDRVPQCQRRVEQGNRRGADAESWRSS